MRRAAKAQPAHIPAGSTSKSPASGGIYTSQNSGISFEVPLITGTGQNDREHWRVKAKRVKEEKEAMFLALKAYQPLAGVPLAEVLAAMARRGPVLVTLTRIAPSSGLDGDNLSGALKAVRDAVAGAMEVNDRESERLAWKYDQKRGPWGVRVEVSARKPEVQGPGWTAEEWHQAAKALAASLVLHDNPLSRERIESLRWDALAMARALGGGK